MTNVGLSEDQFKEAKKAILREAPALHKPYMELMQFLAAHPNYRGKIRGKNPPVFGSTEYFQKTAEKFHRGRVISRPKNSGKTTDPLLIQLFGDLNALSESEVKRATKHHGDFMVLENVVGKILENYLASRLEPSGWVWCSGDFVEKVDFIFRVNSETFSILQVKNKDVTENSSSSAGRKDVPKWARLKGKTARPNWDEFPDSKARDLLSEEDFLLHGYEIGASWFSK